MYAKNETRAHFTIVENKDIRPTIDTQVDT